jgi:hypothetical protein
MANGQPFLGRLAVDLALDIEDCVDALHRFQRQRRDNGKFAARLGGDVGEHEELAPGMRPAGRLDEGRRSTASFVEPVEPGIRIGLENTCIPLQMPFGVITGPVAGIEEHCRRRIMTAKWSIITNIDPGASGRRLALGQYRHRGIVAVDSAGGEYVPADEVIERAQNHGAAADLVGERREAETYAFAGISLRLPIERLVLPVLLEHDHGQKARSRKTTRQHMEWRRGLRDSLAGPAGELLAHVLHDLPLPRHYLQRLGHVLAEFGEPGRTAAGAGGGARYDHPLAR